MIRPGATIQLSDAFTDPDGRYLVTKMVCKGTTVTLANIYGPNEDDSEIYEALCGKVDECENDYTILAGDFNFCLNTSKDRKTTAIRSGRRSGRKTTGAKE